MLAVPAFCLPPVCPLACVRTLKMPQTSIRQRASLARSAPRDDLGEAKRFAVVGAGLAGMAVTWNLMAMSLPYNSIIVDVYDVAGLGAAAAGLLHPFTTKGKLIWRGQEAFGSAMKLVSAAERAMERSGKAFEPFVFRQPIMRPAKTPKQAERFRSFEPGVWAGAVMAASHLDTQQARSLVPGIGHSILQEDVQHAALLLKGGLVLDPVKYLRAIWTACEGMKVEGGPEMTIRLQERAVTSLQSLDVEEGPYDGIIAAAGAANGLIKEVGDRLQCTLSQGYSVHLTAPSGAATENATQEREGAMESSPENMSESFMESAYGSQQKQIREALGLQIDRNRQTAIAEMPQTEAEKAQAKHSAGAGGMHEPWRDGYPEGAPSLLSSTYLAVQGRRRMVVGATKRPGLTPEEALQECGRIVDSNDEVEDAKRSLLPEAERMWPPLGDWTSQRVTTGVRALPPRTQQGSIPLAGALDQTCRFWVVGGLGARGLVYHAWLGQLIAQAALNRNEVLIPEELMRWKNF